MSDEGEKSCPLCAEDMDMTDQQLKPCKCGYEICVWCWHHIMDMAEKDATEGRCPACRTPYNKEKIVGTTAKCDRLVSEMSVEKKLKSQKGKSKTLEGRKQLSSVRVVQRNLVYVVGLPLDFADEDLLQGREYFEQYGKVMKVSISRTAAGAIQQFPNSTCSVYITYSKEEEAVRCIQSVHGFVLDGRPLRACFGTTKYCHAWLRNMPCSNPDCLYLHEIGSQEDSFTKDEIISAYTRVQQITSSSNMQRRSGNVLPPPADDYCNNSSAFTGKPVTTTSINTNQNLATSATISPPNSNSGRSAALPAGASWGTRTSSNQTLSTSTTCFSAPLKQKLDSCNGSVAFSTTAASTNSVSSLHSDSRKKSIPNEESTNSQHNSKMETFESIKKDSDTDVHFASLSRNRQPHSPPANKRSPNTIISDSSIVSSGPALDEHDIDDTDGNVENVSHGNLSMSVHESRQLQDSNVEHIKEPQTSGKATNMTEEASVVNTQTDFRLGMSIQVPQVDMHDMEDDLLSFHNQRIKDPEVAINRVSDSSHAIHLAKHSNIHSPQLNNLDKQVVERTNNLLVSPSNFPSGRAENIFNSLEGNDVEYSSFFPNKEKRSLLGRCEGEVTSNAADMGESSLISNIFSLDLDSWDESITSPRDMVKLLGETDRRQGSFGAPGQRRVQNSSQSRFSFAREEEPISQVSDFGQSIDYFGQAFKQGAATHDFSGSNSFHHEKFSRNGFGQSIFSGTEEDTFASGHSHISSNKLSVSRSQMSAPPGFSAPSRAPPPPPGFTSHERTDQFFDTLSGNHMFDASSLLRNQYQTPSSGNAFSNGDIEFMDPAILAVGKGTVPGGINSPSFDIRSNFPPQLSTRYEDARFQSFLQRSNSIHQNQRFTDLGDNFSNGYGIPSRVMEQSFSNNLSPFSQFTLPQSRNGITSNGQWDGWNEGQNGNNNLSMADLLRNERLGFNRFYGGYEDSKIRMPSSGNLYNGTYGI